MMADTEMVVTEEEDMEVGEVVEGADLEGEDEASGEDGKSQNHGVQARRLETTNKLY